MTEADAIRIVQPRHAMKWLARIGDVPIGTARHWLYVNFSTSRQREIARAALREMDRQDREERAAARRKLEQMAGIDAAMERGRADGRLVDAVGEAGGRAGADPAGAAPRPETPRLRLARRLLEAAARD